MENESAKKALIYVVAASIIGFVVIKITEGSSVNNTIQPVQAKNAIGRIKIKIPSLLDGNDDASVAMKAFIKAYNANEPEDRLISLNEEMKKSMGLMAIKTKEAISIKDANGNDVMIYKL